MSSNLSDTYLAPGQFYGNVINKRKLSSLVLSELKHTTGKKLAEHSHQLANFCLLIKGDYAEYHGSHLFEYKPMTIMFHPPELSHRDEIGRRGGHFFNVELEATWVKRLREYSAVPDGPVGSKGGDLAWLAFKLYRKFKANHLDSDLGVEGLVMTMLAELPHSRIKDEKRVPNWLAQAVDLLHANFQKDLTISCVAHEVGVHPFHLSKVFRHFHQQTIGEYVKRLRVNFACRELLNHETELASIALAAGFADQSHFTRVFKQMTGLTPGAFRAATNR
jgi:AraC family transcriptional regulator